MTEVRFHGRGGQGSVVASNILAEAAFREGKHVQSFPFFGVERRGAPVVAFTRISNGIIRIRHQIYRPDYVVVLDPTLVDKVDILKGLKKGSSILINTDKTPQDFSFRKDFKIATVDASNIAVKFNLGTKSSPIVNTALLGAFSKFTKLINIESILGAVEQKVPLKKKGNIAAAKEAYEKVMF